MVFEQLSESVFRLKDICNVYLLRQGEQGLLIDSGSGAVHDLIDQVGVTEIDWVFHTHHHRDQTDGTPRLTVAGTSVAVPAREAPLFEDAETFWRTRNVFDLYDCSSVDNSPTNSLVVDRRLSDYEVVEWHGLEVECFPTPGHTRGSMTYLVQIDNISYAFTGDFIYSAGRVWTLHDIEWLYSMTEGARVAIQAAHGLRQRQPERIAPSHGDVIDDVPDALAALENNLARYVRFADQGFVTELSPPQPVRPAGTFTQVSEHLIAATASCANFYVLCAENGETLYFDFGFPSEQHMAAGFRFVEHSIDELMAVFNVHPPKVIVPTHYHDDHVCGIPYLQRRFGTEVWASERFADVLERPYAYRLPCLWSEPISVSRRLSEDQSFEWNGYSFDVRHNPGHTWYASSILGLVDGLRVAFTGDEFHPHTGGGLWGNGPVWRNRLGLGDYEQSVSTIIDFCPDVILTGHKGALTVTTGDLEEFRSWAKGMEESWLSLAAKPNEIGFATDPNVVSVDPYQARGIPGMPFEVRVEVRNYFDQSTSGWVRLVAPQGWECTPIEHAIADLKPREAAVVLYQVVPPRDAGRDARYVLPVEAQLGDRRLNPTECLVSVVSR